MKCYSVLHTQQLVTPVIYFFLTMDQSCAWVQEAYRAKMILTSLVGQALGGIYLCSIPFTVPFQ